MCATHPPEKTGLINIFLGILSPQVCLVTLTYTQISAVLAIYSVVAGASISDTGFTMIYEPAHWPSLFWKGKRGHILYAAHPSHRAGLQSVLESLGGGIRLQSSLLRYAPGKNVYKFSTFSSTGQWTTALMKSLPKCSKVMPKHYPHTPVHAPWTQITQGSSCSGPSICEQCVFNIQHLKETRLKD